MNTTQLQEAKRQAAALQAGWLAHQGRRAALMMLEAIFYILALLLLLGDMALIGMGDKLLVAKASNGTTHASTTIQDDRVSAVLMVVYILLGLLALGSFIIARLISKSRKRRAQVQALCETVERI
ncbi:MAG: hypothetical protein JNL52_09025 [Flavobacteriales bacterium]|nr:hypothetical protein [Flavobacteriales bacterium]